MKSNFNIDAELAEILLRSNSTEIELGGKIITKKQLQQIVDWKLPEVK